MIEAYGKLPLSFEANQGQADSRVKFLSRGGGYTLFLTGDEAVLALRKANVAQRSSSSPAAFPRYLRSAARGDLENNVQKPQGHKADPALHRLARQSPGAKDGGQRTGVLHMRLVGANPKAIAAGVDGLPVKSNYFIGNDPKKWRTNVANYAKVKYEGVYPGVDLVYYGNQGQLEYDFVVAPGADPSVVTLGVAAGLSRQRENGGVKPPLRIAANGDLVMKIAGSEVRFHRPVVYQPDAGSSLVTEPALSSPKGHSSLVEGRYKLTGGNQVAFETGSYDPRRPLVIDPVLSYSTFLGGSATDLANDIAVDVLGNAYVTGCTNSVDFPTTAGAFSTSYSGTGPQADCQTGDFGDAFITKLNPAGSALVYSTFLGGSSGDNGGGIAVDGLGDAYIAGFTASPDFPTTPGAFQTQLLGSRNAFVTELNPSGSALVYSTYLGGNGLDWGLRIALDASGNAYITGYTNSANFPVTAGAFQQLYGGGGEDGFVAKLSPGGSALIYSTYLGGSHSDYGTGVAVDASGDAYVVGSTYSSNFPTTLGAFQGAHSGDIDAFLTKLNSAGSALAYSTYLGVGGIGADGNSARTYGTGIALDPSGNAYITGSTTSANFPVTAGAFQRVYGGGGADAFVAKVSSDGSAEAYSTYLGGTSTDGATTMAVDSAGNAYVTGYTSSSDFPVLYPLQGYSGNGYDAFVTEVTPAGSGLVYSTYLGGSSGNQGYSLSVDQSGNAYAVGWTGSSDFPTTPGAFRAELKGVWDAFVSKIASVGPRYSVCLLYDPTKAVHSGATIPIKLLLCDSSGNDLSSSSITVHATSISQISTSTSGAVENSGDSNPDNDFRFDATLGSTGGYIFNLKTTGLSTGTYSVNFTVTGDSFVYAADFQVK